MVYAMYLQAVFVPDVYAALPLDTAHRVIRLSVCLSCTHHYSKTEKNMQR